MCACICPGHNLYCPSTPQNCQSLFYSLTSLGNAAGPLPQMAETFASVGGCYYPAGLGEEAGTALPVTVPPRGGYSPFHHPTAQMSCNL